MAAMHPALRLSNLQNLPLRMRLDAQAACRIDGASTQAAGVLFAFDTARLTDAQEVSLLPLIYHVLNPSHLPTLADLDPGSFDDGTKKALTLRILAVNVACKIISIPAAVGPSLWPRIWPWFQFLYANWDQMHIALKMPENPLLFRIFIYFMSRFCHGGSPAAFVLQTPGIRELLFDIWTRQIPAEDHPVRLRILLLNISNFIMPLVPSEKENMDEMVAGAGGSMEDMAELIVSHLQTILTNKQLNLPEDALVHLVRITVGLILHGDFSTLQGVGKLFEVDWHLLPLGELIDALLERSDFLPTLIDSIIALSDTSAADTGRTLDEALMVIERIILCRQGDIDPVKVMHAGILSAIIHCARVEFPGKDLVTPRLRRILVEALDVSCLYRYNAGALDTASKIPEVQQLAQSAAFVHSETYVHWIAFIKAVQDRRRILDLTYARLEGILARHKICDNSECHQMILRRLLQKCAHCQAVSYCSKACQKSDWTNGGHRDACKSYAFLSLTDRSDRYLIYMDRKSTPNRSSSSQLRTSKPAPHPLSSP
ncbi:hypothetical protein C8F01DRAFT_280852 [Mycena amicta]|nr:hypothetical protein C8F01DRAFT_280852 [Mycena amicta]